MTSKSFPGTGKASSFNDRQAIASPAKLIDHDEEQGLRGNQYRIERVEKEGCEPKGIFFLGAIILVAFSFALSYTSKETKATVPSHRAEERRLSASNLDFIVKPKKRRIAENDYLSLGTLVGSKETKATMPSHRAEERGLSASNLDFTDMPEKRRITENDYLPSGTLVDIELDDPNVSGRRMFHQGVLTKVKGGDVSSSSTRPLAYEVVVINEGIHHTNVPLERVQRYVPYDAVDDARGNTVAAAAQCDVSGHGARKYVPCSILEQIGFQMNLRKGMYTVQILDTLRNITLPARRVIRESHAGTL